MRCYPALLLLMTVNASCESLQTLALPETTILSATLVPDGSVHAAVGNRSAGRTAAADGR